MSKPSVPSPTESVVVIDRVLSWWLFLLRTVKAETPENTSRFKRGDDIDLAYSAARRAALLIFQALCRLEDVSPLQTVSDALVQTPEWFAAMAQLERVRAEHDTLATRQDA